jgi:ribonucleoside-diphosphate reductase beta chain
MAWGTFTCRRHVAADDNLWQVVHDRIGELMGLLTETIVVGNRLFDNKPPFGIDPDEMTAYAADKLTRGLGAIESARGGRPVDHRPRRVAGGVGGEVPLGGPAAAQGVTVGPSPGCTI